MTLSTQFLTMLTMIGMGSYFGAMFDTYNRFLQRGKRSNWLVFINDVLFWLFQGLSIFYVLFLVNKGELRFYIFLALLCGFAAYQSLFKGLYLILLENTISIVKAVLRFFIKTIQVLVYKPIYSFALFVLSIVIFTGKGLLALVKILYKILLFILRVFLRPFSWFLSLLWNVFPKGFKNKSKKLYNEFASLFYRLGKITKQKLSSWKNK